MTRQFKEGKNHRGWELFSGWVPLLIGLTLLPSLLPHPAHAWTIQDYNPWKQLQEYRIFSLTRADPIGVRILVIPVLDEPVNTPVYARVCSEFTTQLRSFASEVWLITDLPEGPVKQGFYTGLSRIMADYRLKNQLSMDLITAMIPDFECDFIALFEVTDYDRYWIDHDLQHRVGLRCVLYDYEDGSPRLEKYFQGGRGRRLEEGAFSEAERFAVKGLVEELERPLRRSVEEREKELQRRYTEINELSVMTNQQEWAIHEYDLGFMKGQMAASRDKANQAERSKAQIEQERDYWKKQADSNKEMAEQYRNQLSATPSSPQATRNSTGMRTFRQPFSSSRFGLPCPPGMSIQPAPQTPRQPIVEPPSGSSMPPRMPTLEPIDLRQGNSGFSDSPISTNSSSVVAFRGFEELPPQELKTGSFMIPPWEVEPAEEWEYLEPEP